MNTGNSSNFINAVIPYYDDINEFLASTSVSERTRDPLFLCLRLHKNDDNVVYKPPFRRGFYFVGLLTNAEKSKISYDNTNVNDLDSLLVFQAPGLMYSFYRDTSTHGYLIYFKRECFSYYKPSLDTEFPFFDIQHTDFHKITHEKFSELSCHFEEVFTAYEKTSDHKIASLKLLALLYQLKEFSAYNDISQQKLANPGQVLLKKFIALVNTNYIEKRRIEDYAKMLFISPNHLSQSVKSVSGKNALSYINERLLTEAKSFISYTDYSIAEIAYKLNFSDPANFGKFFKKLVGITPLEFREKK
ncbi:MAG TPA: AraC family transcriptional regulator [Flavipsychrobacter sp.]|nr:AraC family transcriptional regulator [Flavipsychrobacter sp.]